MTSGLRPSAARPPGRVSRWADRIGQSAFALPVAIGLAVAMLLVSESAYHGSRNQLAQLITMGRLRLEVTRIARAVNEAESAQRGYILTGRSDYLQPFREANADLQTARGHLADFEQLKSDAAMAELVKQLDDALTGKVSEMHEVLQLFETGRQAAARELILTNIGQEQMLRIRDACEGLLQQQNRRIAAGLGKVHGTFELSRFGVAALTAVSLLILVLFLRQSRELTRERAAQEAQLRAERDRLEHEVRSRTAELTALAAHLVTVREDERARLARDLHDELGALLTTAKLDVARIRQRLQDASPELAERLHHLTDALNSGIALKRRIIEDLRPSTLDNLGLGAALEILCAEFAERLALPIDTLLSPVALTRSAELTVFRLVQESLTNAAKYAGARSLMVSLAQDGDQVEVVVQDDGRGFEPGHAPSGHHGLVGMRYRVEAEGGRLQVASAPGRGTTITAQLPAHRPAPSPTLSPPLAGDDPAARDPAALP